MISRERSTTKAVNLNVLKCPAVTDLHCISESALYRLNLVKPEVALSASLKSLALVQVPWLVACPLVSVLIGLPPLGVGRLAFVIGGAIS